MQRSTGRLHLQLAHHPPPRRLGTFPIFVSAAPACRLGFIDHNEYILVRNSSLDIPAVLKVRPAERNPAAASVPALALGDAEDSAVEE